MAAQTVPLIGKSRTVYHMRSLPLYHNEFSPALDGIYIVARVSPELTEPELMCIDIVKVIPLLDEQLNTHPLRECFMAKGANVVLIWMGTGSQEPTLTAVAQDLRDGHRFLCEEA